MKLIKDEMLKFFLVISFVICKMLCIYNNMDVYKFYNEVGWTERKKDTNDAILFEDLRSSAKKYVSHSRNKINKYITNQVTASFTAELLFNPLLIISSLGLALLMLAGFLVRLKLKDGILVSLPALFYMSLNAYIFLISIN